MDHLKWLLLVRLLAVWLKLFKALSTRQNHVASFARPALDCYPEDYISDVYISAYECNEESPNPGAWTTGSFVAFG